MSYKNLHYIVEIAQQQNMSRAAERLFISQSALSIYLKKTEAELGVALFSRQNNKLVPTPEGDLFVDTAKKILQLENELYKKLRVQAGRPIAIGIGSEMAMTIFSSIFPKFREEYPSVNVSLIDQRSDALIAQLEEGRLDLIITTKPRPLSNSWMHCILLKKEEMVVVMPPGHPYAHLASYCYDDPPVIDLSLLKDEKYIIAAPDTVDHQIIKRIFKDYEMDPEILWMVNLIRPPCQMVQEGVGLTIQPSFSVPRDMDILVCRPDRPYHRYVQLIYKKDHALTREEQFLIKQIRHAYVHWYDDAPSSTSL